MSNAQLETAIEAAWDARDTITPDTTGEVREAIEDTLDALDSGSFAWPSGARTAPGM
jgi:2,3,4,5-tetrahydropyridine-2-carboxylate N-succinyltransferase